MYIKLLLAIAMLMTLFACDSEQVKKIKEKVKESTSKVSSGNDEKESLSMRSKLKNL